MEIHTRIEEHRKFVRRQPRDAMEYQILISDSALAEQVLDTGHSVDVDEVQILRRGIKPHAERLHAVAVEIAKAG